MPYGLQAWDASGNLILDTTTTLLKWVGSLSVGWNFTGSAQSGQLYVPAFASYPLNKPFLVRRDGILSPNVHDDQPTIWVDGDYIKWSYPNADPGTNGLYRTNATVDYGLR